MQRVCMAMAVAAILPALAGAQTPGRTHPAPTTAPTPAVERSNATGAAGGVSFSQLTPTAEMWFYEQAKERSDDPKAGVRRAAQFRAEQRRNRIAAMKWFGMSNSRPIASPTPTMGFYSPTWTANSAEPYHWRGVMATPVTVGPTVVVADGAAYGLW